MDLLCARVHVPTDERNAATWHTISTERRTAFLAQPSRAHARRKLKQGRLFVVVVVQFKIRPLDMVTGHLHSKTNKTESIKIRIN